jgi:hypothetical protein
MQGARNWGHIQAVGSPSETWTDPEKGVPHGGIAVTKYDPADGGGQTGVFRILLKPCAVEPDVGIGPGLLESFLDHFRLFGFALGAKGLHQTEQCPSVYGRAPQVLPVDRLGLLRTTGLSRWKRAKDMKSQWVG